MKIPKKYVNILENNMFLKGTVYSTIETFGSLFDENRLYFFEEYTNHGTRHIESVLQSTYDIIPEESLTHFFDSENVCALILSVLLHDIGMHHSFKSFNGLIKQKKILIPELDKESWADLWEHYIEEAKKFTSKQKNEIFGSYDYVIRIPHTENIDDLDGYQKKLVGEFLRRHHPRIAHEIALFGFHTGDEIIKFASEYDIEKRDIIGLIARSHGMEMRDTYDYVQKKFFRLNKNPHNIHLYYLMSILRIADYFQIDINRLSLVSLKLRTFRSPISNIEHAKHFAIKEIRPIDEDPETLFIRALPVSSKVYCILIDLVQDIQNELDRTWAVLGEKYGKDKVKPTLTYRRVISNLNERSYLDTITFVPEKISFGSDSDLARLLVEPLYGNNPTYGVRELIQNSVDAIHERIFLEKLGDNFDSKIDINIQHDASEQYYFEIVDNGKGMNIKEIKNYFLKAGATNRKSKEWDDLYLDENREAKVLKSGKFGVGILSAFLIGKEIEVKTKRFDSTYGLHFKANINSENVEVTKIVDCPIGTTIRININSRVLDDFRNTNSEVPWDKWYTLTKPKIKFNCVLGIGGKYGYNEHEPDYFENSENWVEFYYKPYSKLRWSYDGINEKQFYSRGNYGLTCNGLIIPNPPDIYTGGINPPDVQVFDFNGILPINLSRNALDSQKLPFENELVESVYTEILKEIIQLEPVMKIQDRRITISRSNPSLKLFGRLKSGDFFKEFVYLNNGYLINNRYLNDFLAKHKVIRMILLDTEALPTFSLDVDPLHVFILNKVFGNISELGGYIQGVRDKTIEWAILAPNVKYSAFANDDDYKVETPSIHGQNVVIIKRKDISKIPVSFKDIPLLVLKHIQSIVCYSKISHVSELNNQFSSFLANIFYDLQVSILPYDESERKQKITALLKKNSQSSQ